VNPKGEGLSNIRELAPWQNLAEDTESAIEYLRILPDVRADRIALLGFCWGGGVTFATATKIPTLKAVVVYYGPTPNPIDSVQNIQAPILAHYGEKDLNITSRVPETEAAMKKYNKSYEYKIYPGAPHAFNDDTNEDRYMPAAAKDAWERTAEFLKRQLTA
jgi:carboxymethylenebutenolidase